MAERTKRGQLGTRHDARDLERLKARADEAGLSLTEYVDAMIKAELDGTHKTTGDAATAEQVEALRAEVRSMARAKAELVPPAPQTMEGIERVEGKADVLYDAMCAMAHVQKETADVLGDVMRRLDDIEREVRKPVQAPIQVLPVAAEPPALPQAWHEPRTEREYWEMERRKPKREGVLTITVPPRKRS